MILWLALAYLAIGIYRSIRLARSVAKPLIEAELESLDAFAEEHGCDKAEMRARAAAMTKLPAWTFVLAGLAWPLLDVVPFLLRWFRRE